MDSGNEAATKTDIEKLRAELKTDVAELKTDVAELKTDVAELKTDVAALNERVDMIRTEFQHGFDDLKETLRDIQTELLKAFYSYTASNDDRVAAAEAEAAYFKKRLGTIESRLTDVERRLNTPPPQQP